MKRVLGCAVLVLLLAAGCARQEGSNTRQLTERQRDSTLGKSVLPGAGAVTRALEESDKAASAARQMDAQVDSIGR